MALDIGLDTKGYISCRGLSKIGPEKQTIVSDISFDIG
jgi:hypothetical protein